MLNFTCNSDTFELRELVRSVRRFAEGNLHDVGFHKEHFYKMSQLGLPAMATKEDLGGLDSDNLWIAASIFELARVQLGPAIYLAVHLMVSGLIEKWSKTNNTNELIQSLSKAEKLAAFCLTESCAGSDAASLQTKADDNGNGWTLNGEKIYITSGGVADIYLVFARTSKEQTRGISAFLVEKDNAGISFGQPEKKMGCEGAPITTVKLDNCKVERSSLLGEIGEGYKIALSGLESGRVNISAAACGLSSKAIELARDHAKDRKQFGHAIAEFQGLQFLLAEMFMKFRASVLLTRHAAEQLDTSKTIDASASVAKCFSTDSAMQISTDSVQVLGGAGYLADYGVEQIMRDAKMLQIVEGTNQIQRILIARALLM